ncbi:MAG: tetratricopeptide repeat protein [Bacteroidota bacterium]
MNRQILEKKTLYGKRWALLGLFCLLAFESAAQRKPTDSLYQVMQSSVEDTVRASAMIHLSNLLKNVDPDSAQNLALQVIALAEKNAWPRLKATGLLYAATMATKKGAFEEADRDLQQAAKLFEKEGDFLQLADVLQAQGNIFRRQSKLPKALKAYIRCAELRRDHNASPSNLASSYTNIGNIYYFSGEYDKAIENYQIVLQSNRKHDDLEGVVRIYNNLFAVAYAQEQYDLGINYLETALHLSDSLHLRFFKAANLTNLGEVYRTKGQFRKAMQYTEAALDLYTELDDKARIAMVLKNMGLICEELGDPSQAIRYYRESLQLALRMQHASNIRDAHQSLSELHANTGNFPEAYQSLLAYQQIKDSLSNASSQEQLNQLKTQYETAEKERQIELLQAEKQRSAKERNALLGGFALMAFLSLIALWAIYQKRKAMQVLQIKKQEADQLLVEKEAVQQQLIQSEKMATIGQLTAGIAHEINNPINFIASNTQALQQDFEELDELLHIVDEIERQSRKEGLVQLLIQKGQSTDVALLREEIGQLLQSIRHGTDRTKSIVDSLRNFSRSTNEHYEEANIHEALDSALLILGSQLNEIELHKKYASLPPVNCQLNKLSQVFLNIINNGIQAMEQKGVMHIRTQSDGKRASIYIQDDGHGMSADIQTRIFDPFFTTKAAGKGTGLGLAISQNIIRAHGGQIEVKSEEGKGTTFIIHLPLK